MAATEKIRQKSDKTKKDSFFREYVGRLTDENLRFLDMRLKHRLVGDLADAVNFLSSSPDMDHHLSGAKGATEFYDMLDALQKQVEREARKRHS